MQKAAEFPFRVVICKAINLPRKPVYLHAQNNGACGAAMTEELKGIGLEAGHRRVGCLMRQNGISVVDISYIWTREGWLYLAVVLDIYSRRVIGPLSVIQENHLPVNGCRVEPNEKGFGNP